ncbi:hypothetical protein [Francisella sp. LA112445]|uniref:hypothetical protein n=1 Tax=Francisella sp. LA112445 TaxID=1395624 RepID=UPI001788A41A|nr:hypothetical protein [Francisella sp. LA112445]QIW10146.1 hypothetical protein FIP56_05365 [Francisella sp. LA112445]
MSKLISNSQQLINKIQEVSTLEELDPYIEASDKELSQISENQNIELYKNICWGLGFLLVLLLPTFLNIDAGGLAIIVSVGLVLGIIVVYVTKIQPYVEELNKISYIIFSKVMSFKYHFKPIESLKKEFLVDTFGLNTGDRSYGIESQARLIYKDSRQFHFEYFYYTKEETSTTDTDGNIKRETTTTKHNIYGFIINGHELPCFTISRKSSLITKLIRSIISETTYQPVSVDFRKNFYINSGRSIDLAKLFTPRNTEKITQLAPDLNSVLSVVVSQKYICAISSKPIVDLRPKYLLNKKDQFKNYLKNLNFPCYDALNKMIYDIWQGNEKNLTTEEKT